MNNRAIVLQGNRPVRIKTEKYTIIPKTWDFSGALNEFDLKLESDDSEKTYVYINYLRLYKDDKDKIKAGFYPKNSYEEYRNSNKHNAIYKLGETWLNSSALFSAQEGDVLEIEIIEFNSPFTPYYTQYLYKFKIQNTLIDFTNPLYYPQLIDTDPESSKYNVKIDTSVDLLQHITGKFYTKNFGERVNETEHNKPELSKIMTLIGFRINFIIVDNILDKIAINDLNVVKDISQWPNLPLVDRFIGYLLQDWGYIENLPPSLILEDLSVDAFKSYYLGLVNLYKFFYLKDENKLFPIDSQGNPVNKRGKPITPEENSERRLAYIIEVLPPTSIAFLPYSYKISYLERLMKESMSEQDEGRVLEILYSFAVTVDQQEREDFLDFLLKKSNGNNINFDILYNKMNDEKLSYILPTISMFFTPGESNRGNFCLVVFKIWEKSRFNFYFIPPNITPNTDGINPNAFFLNEGISYYQTKNVQSVFDFTASETKIWPQYQGNPGLGLKERTQEKFYADKQLDGEKVKITKIVSYNYNWLDQDGKYFIKADGMDREDTYNFNLHIFQSISIIGYKSNIDSQVALPEVPYIPAFLFYYHQEFDRLRKNYAMFSFAIDIAIEASLFFLTGGLGTIRHLRHLKFVTKMGRAFKGEIAGSEVVYKWTKFDSAETFSVTASMCMSYMNYLSDTADNTPERELANKAGTVFMLLTFLGVGASFVTKSKAVNAAKITKQADNYSDLPNDVRQVIDEIAGDMVQAISDFRTQKLTTRPNILTKFDAPTWTDELRQAFYDDFKKLTDAELDLLNDAQAIAVDNWKALLDQNIIERNLIEFITTPGRTEAILRYYNSQNIRDILEIMERSKRWEFLDNFGTQPQEWFNFLNNNTSAITRWANLDTAGKIFAKNKPDKWLYIFDRLYENYSKWSKMPNAEILNKFGQKGLDLVNEVETYSLNYIVSQSSTKLLKSDIVISGMKDKITGISSDFFHNFSGYDFNKGGAYDIFMNGELNNPNRIFPNLRAKIDDIILFNKHNYNLKNIDFLGNTGKYPGAHAEIRALDDLAKKKFPNYMTNPPSDVVFNNWLKNDVLGYNRNIQHGITQEKVIMHTCADCYHILDLVTFINPLN